MPSSTSNSNTNSNPQNSANNSSNASRSRSPYTSAVFDNNNTIRVQAQRLDERLVRATHSDRGSVRSRPDFDTFRPSTPSTVYIVTSNFTSQTTADGVNLSESDIVGFQILAVFARLDDANSYAEHECEEIDAGVRRRRRRSFRGGAVGSQEGEGIRAEVVVREDGTVIWTVEDVGQIEVGQWTVQ